MERIKLWKAYGIVFIFNLSQLGCFDSYLMAEDKIQASCVRLSRHIMQTFTHMDDILLSL